jgi:hypothetical protein
MNVESDDGRGMRGEGAMQRIPAPLNVTLDRLGMADMIRAAGEEKTFERMIDARIAIIGNGAAGRDIDSIDDAGADIENGGFIEENAWRSAGLKRTQDNLPMAVKTQKSRKRY